jgi:hypothetical protein
MLAKTLSGTSRMISSILSQIATRPAGCPLSAFISRPAKFLDELQDFRLLILGQHTRLFDYLLFNIGGH